MIGALGTLVFFAATPVFANRAAQRLGCTQANFWRLALATVVLGGWAYGFGRGAGGPAFGWFFLGGVVGFGIGGVAMFQSLPRLGSNLSTLLVQCGSAIVAAGVEYAWLGTALSVTQVAWTALTLTGVILGLLPRSLPRVSPREWRAGLAWACVSAAGQGVGAVISRKAFGVAAALSAPIDPGTAAYERAIGGVLIAACAWAIAMACHADRPRTGGRAWPWVIGNTLCGPVLGVTCYQWALRTTPAGIVQPIVAAAPLLTIPLALWIEGARPRLGYYAGAVLAIAGVTGLILAR